MDIQRTYECGFEAAHIIEGHPKCGNKHGHSYKLRIIIAGETEKWLDFADIKTNVDSYIMTNFDHQDLGNITAEEIAGKIAQHLSSLGWQGEISLNETAKFGVAMVFGKAVMEENITYARYQ